ncbi:MAG: sigma factor [Longimicrobiales bacterium]|nr:sigma factor [Longimicrobiales bacterium]
MTEAPERNTREFEEEALQHLEVVSRFVRRLSMSPDLAEDLVQDTFLRAYKS